MVSIRQGSCDYHGGRFCIVSYPGSSASVFSGYHLQTPNVCGLENSHGPYFYVTSVKVFNIFIFRMGKE